jgi:hypothetical protein
MCQCAEARTNNIPDVLEPHPDGAGVARRLKHWRVSGNACAK